MEPLLGGFSDKRSQTGGRIALLMTLVAAVFFIVALATPAVFQVDGRSLGQDLHVWSGPFRVCSHVNNDEDTCRSINQHCKYTVSNPVLTMDIPIVKNCEQFNAARGLLVVATIFCVLAFLLQLLVLTSAGASRARRGASVFMALLGALCGMVSMALFASLRNNDDVFKDIGADLGYGFWLLTVGWVLAFLAAMPFCTK